MNEFYWKMTAFCTLLALSPLNVQAEALDYQFGLAPAFGFVLASDKKDSVGVQAYMDLGLSEFFSVELAGGYASHVLSSGESGASAFVNLGVAYHLNVFVVVPFCWLRLGWLHWIPNETDGLSGLGVSTGLGFDYLWTEYFTIGLAFEYQGMLSDFDTFPVQLALLGRVGFRFAD